MENTTASRTKLQQNKEKAIFLVSHQKMYLNDDKTH